MPQTDWRASVHVWSWNMQHANKVSGPQGLFIFVFMSYVFFLLWCLQRYNHPPVVIFKNWVLHVHLFITTFHVLFQLQVVSLESFLLDLGLKTAEFHIKAQLQFDLLISHSLVWRTSENSFLILVFFFFSFSHAVLLILPFSKALSALPVVAVYPLRKRLSHTQNLKTGFLSLCLEYSRPVAASLHLNERRTHANSSDITQKVSNTVRQIVVCNERL